MENLRSRNLQYLFSRRGLSSWLVLAIGLLLVFLTWLGLRVTAFQNFGNVFELRADEVIESIEERMRGHASILLGGAGFFDASVSVERAEWHAYVERLQLQRNYPGIQGVGYAQMVKPADLQAHIAEIRAQGYPNFTVRPEGPRALYSSIIYLEPFAERNLAAFGYDMLSQPTRAEAMRRAAESGNPAISGKVTLEQETHGPTQAGFLMYLPIYSKGQQLTTAADRWAALQGFVYSPYRMNDLMQGILEKQELDLGFTIYDGTAANEESRMYASDEADVAPSVFNVDRHIEIYGRTWTIQLHSHPRFVANAERDYASEALIFGSILVLLLAALVFNINIGRERAQKLAEDMSWRTRAIVDTALDGIITIDAKGKVETFNPAAAKIFGYVTEDVIGQNVKMLMPEPYRGEHDGYLGNYLTTGEAKVIGIGREVVGRRKDGSTFPMELAVSEMVVAGTRMFTGIVHDITERKQAEKTKQEFISTVSHELRTPLTSIKGSLGLMKSGTIGTLPDSLGKMLDVAYNNCDRLVRLINEMLDIEKIEAGKMDFQMAPLNLALLLEHAIDANKGYGSDRGMRFVLGGEQREAPINGDQDRLMQVMANLMSNAAKFSPEGGTVEILLSQRNEEFRVEVIDHGPGIPIKFRDKIFGKFAQADSSDTRQKGGTGLGLNISRAIVEQHGGTMGFETEIGKGSTFYFDLPKWSEQSDGMSAIPGTVSKHRILICEDDADIATVLAMRLEQDGYISDIAGSAAEAEALLEEQSYDAVTLDIWLPDKNGITLLRELRTNPKTKDLPIIVVSVKSPEVIEDWQGNVIRIVDWIQKPIDEKRLADALRRAMASSVSGKARILHVEDDADLVQVVRAVVGDLADLTPAATVSAAKALLGRDKFELVILDMTLPDGQGEDLLAAMATTLNEETPVIVFSATEVSDKSMDRFKAALLKSTTSNHTLLQTIQSAINAKPNSQAT